MTVQLLLNYLLVKHKHTFYIAISIFTITLATFFLLTSLNSTPHAPSLKNGRDNVLFTASNNIFTTNIGTKDGSPQVAFQVDSSSITFTLSGINQVEGERLDRNTILYENILPNTDLQYTTLSNGVKEEIIIKSRRGDPLRSPVPSSYLFDLDLAGTTPTTLTARPDGVISLSPTFTDSNGKYLFHFEEPYAYDATGTRTDDVLIQIGEDRSTPGRYYLKLTVDPTWLNNPSRVYPITIDPTVVHDTTTEFSAGTLNRVKDTGSGDYPSLETWYQELPADEHTVGLWHMNEESDNTCSGGEDACDSSNNANHGTATGTTITDAKLNKGREFNGSSDYVSIPASSALDLQNLTIEAWIYSDDFNHDGFIFEKTTNGSVNTQYSLFLYSSDILYFRTYNTTPTVDNLTLTISNYLENGKWNHIVCTYDGNNKSIYINGILAATKTYSETLQTNPAGTSIIGAYGSGDAYFYDGLIDEVRISNIARTPEEIKAAASRRPSSIYTSEVLDLTKVESWNSLSWDEWGVATGDGETLYDDTDLVAQWNFNETSGTAADNAEGTAALDGTLSGFDSTASQDADPDSSWTANNRRWGVGALQFDGVDSIITVSDNDSLSFGSAGTDSPFSISTWVYPKNLSESTYDWIIKKRGGDSEDEYQMLFNQKKVAVSLFTGNGNYITNKTNRELKVGQWYHITSTYDGSESSSGIKIYVDGKLEPSTGSTVGTYTGMSNGSHDVTIGSYIGSYYLDGVLDSMSIFSRELTAHEILSNYNSTNIEFQTRVGADTSPDDGSWDDWTPTTGETAIATMDSDATNWSWDNTATYMPQAKSDESNIKVEGTGSLEQILGKPQIDANTVALWHLDETNGDNASDDIFDATTNNYDGGFTGTNIASSVVNGISGKAREFNGTDDYITFSSEGSDFSIDTYSISAWIYRTNDSGGYEYIVDNRDVSGDGIGMTITSSDLLKCQHNTSNSESTNTINLNQWYHFACIADATNINAYVNGALVNSTTKVGSISESTDVTIGVRSHTSPDNFFPGLIDEVKISDTARTEEEIAESYRSGRDHYLSKTITSTDLSSKSSLPFWIAGDRPGTYLNTMIGQSPYANYQPDANTVGLWHLDEESGSGAYLKDSSGYGYNATEGQTPSYIEGKIGKARYLDGTTGEGLFLMTSAEAALYQDDAKNFTYETWFKASTTSSGDLYGRIVSRDCSDYFCIKMDQSTGLGLTFDYSATESTSKINFSNQTDWHHTAGVWDTTASTFKWYLDGQLIFEDSSLTSFSTNSRPIVVGGNTELDGDISGNEFIGSIDEVRISDTARTASEIREAYEVGLRTHPITIDFAASGNSGNLITSSSDYSFTIDATAYGLDSMGSSLYKGDKIIVRENYDGTEYIAQGTVTAITASTGAVTVSSWDSGGTFPSGGYTANATFFKWQREYWPVADNTLSTHMDAITNLTFRLTNGSEGRTVWLDDLRSNSAYLTTDSGSTITSSTGNQYFQYRAIMTSLDEAVSATLSAVTLDYVENVPPNTPSLDVPTDIATNQSLLPVLKTTTTDSESDYLRYKIELCEDVGMSTSCQTFTQTAGDQTGWSGQDTQTSTAYTSGTQGVYTLQTALSANDTYYWRSYAIDPGGSNTWSSTQGTPYSFTTTTAPTAPTTPYTEGATNPSNVNDTTPEFSAIHNDPDGDSANYYQIEVNTASDFSGTVMWNSGKSSMTTTADTVRSPDISYAGTTLSLNGSIYYWRIKFWDTLHAEGTVSATANFTMNYAPTSSSACRIQETSDDSSLTIIWTDTSDNEDYYEIERSVDSGGWSDLSTTIPADSTSYEDSTISTSHTYRYRVASYLTSGPTYGDWCYTDTLTLELGFFNFEGINFEGLEIN